MDGVDVALIHSDGQNYTQTIAHVHQPFPEDLQQQLRAVCQAMAAAHGDYPVAPTLVAALTQVHITAIETLLAQSDYSKHNIAAIGFHGQTLYHNVAQQRSIQIGDAQQLARAFGLPVVHQFRQQDIANGGQGAPLAPAYHQVLAQQHQLTPCAMINCGGITNATIITDDLLTASDLGPGMCLLDHYMRAKTQGQMPVDLAGELSHQGHVNQRLYEVLMQTNPQINQWPQSFDVHDFILPEVFLTDDVSLADGAATLVYYGAIVLGLAFLRHCRAHDITLQRVICVGGGWYNRGFREAVAAMLDGIELVTAAQLGWQTQAIEAECFAYLALRCLAQQPSSWPETTGVDAPCVNGVIFYNE